MGVFVENDTFEVDKEFDLRQKKGAEAPTMPKVTLSLGATKPFPPNTWRGTIMIPEAESDAPFIKFLLVDSDLADFFIL